MVCVEVFMTVMLDIYDFPKCLDYIRDNHPSVPISAALRLLGYKSVVFDIQSGMWDIDEAEYTWFIVRWS
jgi:hypothetical protein